MYTSEAREQITDGYLTARRELRALPLQLIGGWYQKLQSPRAKEYLAHGVCRRIGLLRRCVDNVFEICPVDRVELLSDDERADLEINMHAFVVNVHGLLDNLAWVTVFEKAPELERNRWQVGLFKENVQALLPEEAKRYLGEQRILDWFETYATNYRDALVHRIPLYVPRSGMTDAEVAKESELEARISERMKALDFESVQALRDEQAALGSILPVFKHSFGDEDAAGAMAFHAQFVADVNTILAIVRAVVPASDHAW
jgi:hypothetical protein